MAREKGKVTFRSANVDETVSVTSRLLCSHRLIIERRNTFEASLVRTELAGISFNKLIYGAELEVRAACMGNDVFLLEVPLSGVSVTRLGTKKVVTDKRVGCLFSPSAPFSSEWSADCSKILVTIDRDRVEKQLSRLIGQTPWRPLAFDMEVPFFSEAARALRGLIDVMITEAEVLSCRPERSFLHSSLEASFLSALLLSQPHNYTDLLSNPRRSAAIPWYIRRAEDFVRRNSTRQISLTEIATSVGVSPRTLQIGFQKFRGFSPMKILRDYRLDQVNRLLEEAGGKGHVAEFARATGFTDMSKFARTFRNRFGCTPRQALLGGGRRETFEGLQTNYPGRKYASEEAVVP